MEPIEIFDGAYHFPQAIDSENLSKLVIKNNFYTPQLKNGQCMNLKMLCLGKHWNSCDYKYYDRRVDVDNELVEKVPRVLIEMFQDFSTQVFPYHNPIWDICIINKYNEKSSLGMHIDNSESYNALSIGHPVISASIGYDAIFRVGGFVRNSDYTDILLKSGDLFIFGGASRLRYHGINKIIPNDSNLKSRINFTLRKY